MSLDLKDFRGRITREAHCLLEAQSQATGRDKQEIVREILHEWASRELRIANIAHKYMLAEGLGGSDDGASGNGGDSRT